MPDKYFVTFRPSGCIWYKAPILGIYPILRLNNSSCRSVGALIFSGVFSEGRVDSASNWYSWSEVIYSDKFIGQLRIQWTKKGNIVETLFQNHPRRYTRTEVFHDNLTLPKSTGKCWLERDLNSHLRNPLEPTFFSWLRQCQIIMKNFRWDSFWLYEHFLASSVHRNILG